MSNQLVLRYEVYETVIHLSEVSPAIEYITVEVKVDVSSNLSDIAVYLKQGSYNQMMHFRKAVEGNNPVALTNQTIKLLKDNATKYKTFLPKEAILSIPDTTFQEL